MTEFLSFIFSGPNVIVTFILCFSILYWIIVMIGAIDMDMIDVDIDIDGDFDVDVDADVDGAGGESGIAWLNKLLYFFNLGRVPFMVWLTIVGLIAWTGAVTVNFFLGIDSFLIGTLISLASLFAAMLVAKPLTYPLVKMFDSLEKTEGLKNAIGQVGEVLYPNKDSQPGEVEIIHEGSHIKIFVLPSSSETKLMKNQKVLVISKSDKDNKIYIVEPYN